MAKPLTRDENRDKKLIADYLKVNDDGNWTFITRELVGIYEISSTRIYQILAHYGIAKRKNSSKE